VSESSFSQETAASSLLDDVKPTARRLRDAYREVQDAEIPENTIEALWQGAKAGMTDPSAHVAGAFFPGIGHAVGGAFAAWRQGDRQRKILQADESAVDDFWSELRESVERAIWRLLEVAEKRGYKFVMPLTSLRAGFDELAALGDKLEEDSDQGTEWLEVVRTAEALVERMPDIPLAHCLLSQAHFEHGNFHASDVAAYKAHELDPDYIFAAFMFFRARLGKKQIAESVECANYLMHRWPENDGMKSSIAANLYDLQDFGLVAEVAGRAIVGLPKSFFTEIISIRLAAMAGDFETGKRKLLELVNDSTIFSVSLANTIRHMEDLRELLSEAEIKGVFSRPTDISKVARLLFPITDKVFFGSIPADRGAAMIGVGSALKGEQPLIYVDDTLSGDGKNGLILTRTRIIWKGFWSDAIDYGFNDLIAPLLIDGDEGENSLKLVPSDAEDEDDLIEVSLFDSAKRRALYCILCLACSGE
jgi:hypothetical protein